MLRLLAVYCLSVVLALTSGCAATYVVAPASPRAAKQQLKVGQEVVIRLNDAKSYRATVDCICDDGLHTDVGTFAYADIQRVEVRKVSPLRTTGAVIGAFLLISVARVFGAP
ncbi:hypothetical protein E4T66_16700 [Sinimarinibacterium sp. CAU 1509]|uniref:hypothetical protein n=1 Tax=Sinimarinibacterium sp. CAU 1509 TaxID=2562283 RepID=UPI0010AD636A|nr:hypothetical protein [Sinimarinibacterium sp. CAU 1509]TJY58330.1 hypothetical protein E4T66_16700 [Sinimarinibacterium sp. CAU 1509]